jgi:Tfp pilus assembly protein PilO
VVAENTKYQNLVQLEKDTQTLRQNYSDVRGKSEQILAQLPAKSEEERLLALLSQIAVQNGVVMSSFAPGGAPSSETSALSVYGASVSVTGTYQTVQSFIKSVEYTARFIDIKSVSLAGDKSSVSAGIILQAYYQQAAKDSTNKGVASGK